jgi:hypothetical protein
MCHRLAWLDGILPRPTHCVVDKEYLQMAVPTRRIDP